MANKFITGWQWYQSLTLGKKLWFDLLCRLVGYERAFRWYGFRKRERSE